MAALSNIYEDSLNKLDVDKARFTPIEAYAKSLRDATRGLWTSRFDRPTFGEAMFSAIERHLEVAWREGAAECGIRPDERTAEEQATLERFIDGQIAFVPRFGGFIEENNRESGGLLRTSLKRLPPWVNRWNEVKAIASETSCGDQKFIWLLGEAEHCFPEGTRVRCWGGLKNIEDVQIGDYVWTTDGFRPVTNLFRKMHLGDMIEVNAAGRKVIATPNHPFLTQRGWIRADALTLEDTIFIQDDPYSIYVEAMFPDTLNSIAASSKVFILGVVSFLLGLLSVGKWLKSSVTVPVFAVYLYDKVANLAVNDEARLNQKERFILNTKVVKYLEKFNLKFGGSAFLKSSPTFGHLFEYPFLFFGMVYPILPKFFFWIIEKHRIIFGHVLSGFRVYNFVGRRFIESESKHIGFSKHLGMNKVNLFSYFGSTIGRIMGNKIFSFIFSPNLRPSLFWPSMQLAIIKSPISLMPTSRTSFNIADLFSRITCISALNGAIFKSSIILPTSRVNHNFKGRTAQNTNKFSRGFGSFFPRIGLSDFIIIGTPPTTVETPFSIVFKTLATKIANKLISHKLSPYSVQSLDTLYHNSITVYNLEVDEVHNYIANGFVVHNCKTCLKLNGRVMRASRWRELDVHPQDTRPGKLICRGFE